MRPIHHVARLSAAVLALSLASVGSAPAQTTAPYGTRAPVRAPNQPSVDRALREFGFNPNGLRAEQQRAIDSAWGLLFPGVSQYRTTLNSSQATALVYVALVHGRQRGGGGWNGNGGRDDHNNGREDHGGWDDRDGRDGRNGRDRDDWEDRDDRGGRGGAQCVDVNRRVYDVENALNDGGGRSLFLNDTQKRAVRESARDVQRLAIDRGWRRVADRAGAVIESVNESMPDRTDVRARVQALKSALDDSCGNDDSRRY